MLDFDESAMPRVYALHNLAQKFPPESEAQLSSQDLSLLRELTRKHAAALAEKIGGMERAMVPALTSLGAHRRIYTAAAHGLGAGREDGFRSAGRVDVLGSQLLGMTPGSAVPSDLIAAMKELEANLQDCQKLLK